MREHGKPLDLSDSTETSVQDIAEAWERELPGIDVESILVITTLWRTAKQLMDARGRTLRHLGMDAATLDLLSTLRRAGPPYRLTTDTLAKRCLVSAGAISQRLTRAETAGFVVREPAGRKRKSVAVTLTETGHRALGPVVSELLSEEADYISIFTQTERRQLVNMLRHLDQHVSALRKESDDHLPRSVRSGH